MRNIKQTNLSKTFFLITFLLFFTTTLFSNALVVQNVKSEIAENEKTINQTQQDVVNENTNEIEPYSLGFIINLIQNKNFKSNSDSHIEQIDNEMDKIIANINQEYFYNFDNNEYEKNIQFLNSKININSKYDNLLAVSRDVVKITILNNKKSFAQTINSIIDGKNAFKDKKYFNQLLDVQIQRLNTIDLTGFTQTASKIVAQQDSLSVEFKTVFKTLQMQIKANLLVFNYLKSNMNEYRPSSFILDELSLKYIISKIDSISFIKNISQTFDYYFNISIGKMVILIAIFILFYFINKKVLPFFTKLFTQKLSKKIKSLDITILEIVPSDFAFLIAILVYIFAAQISLFLLIDIPNIVNKLLPWFNTLYLALLAYLLYRILTNYINLSSDKLFHDHPNMRKEMVDFVLRILKVIILISLGFFLLIQLGFDIKAILASLGIGGIAIALAAKDTLSNFFGSLNIITDNAFSQGDWIEAGNIEGTVVDIRMRTTRIRTFENAMITVPNAQLANISILNWSKRVIGRRIKMKVGITYSSKMSDIENLVKDIKEMLQEHPMIATSRLNIDKKPYLLKKEDLMGIKNDLLVYIDEYGSSSINILIYCFSRSPVWEDWLETKQDVIVQISKLVQMNNCEFAFPTQTIHLEDSKSTNDTSKL